MCIMKCASNQYFSNGTCQNCPSTCTTCVSGESCNGCSTGFFASGGSCVAECPNATVKSQNKCIKIQTCPDGYYQNFQNNGECSQCGGKCLKCVSSTACYQCDGSFNLIGFDTKTNKYYEVSAEVGISIDSPSLTFGTKFGKNNTQSFNIGASSCMSSDQLKTLQSLGGGYLKLLSIVYIILTMLLD